MTNILKKIILQKKIDIRHIKKKNSLGAIDKKIKLTNNFLDFKKTLTKYDKKNYVSLIAEIKKASPSAGIIVKDFDHIKIADIFLNNGAACLSVLTEEKFFLGSLSYINEIKKKFKIPILAKDFFIDPFKFLILSVLDVIVY